MVAEGGLGKLMLRSDDRVVFFGDSITAADPGYVSIIAEMLAALYPEKSIEIINRGVGGDNVENLLARVGRHVIAELPDWVSIMIGINDCYIWDNHLDLPLYEKGLNELVRRLKAETNATILLCSPTIIGEDPDGEFNKKLQDYVNAVYQVAAAHSITTIPIHEAFIHGLRRAWGTTDKKLFTVDDVHLNTAGNTLLATAWLKAMGAFEDLLNPPSEGRLPKAP